ncbi:TPA: hypothetical protein DEP58_04025 [Patescibacteria group bacterium]|nr:MAG: hypothetical protein UU98_C0005G0007 [Parcubacteria group bacterium GW2011_GWD2_42_14]HCC05442.1 hypothetical protein [Patescibacteria group bacterium]
MQNYTGVIIRKIPGTLSKEWKVKVEDLPENGKYAGKSINTTSDIQGLDVGIRVSLKVIKTYGNPKNPYEKLNIREKIPVCN